MASTCRVRKRSPAGAGAAEVVSSTSLAFSAAWAAGGAAQVAAAAACMEDKAGVAGKPERASADRPRPGAAESLTKGTHLALAGRAAVAKWPLRAAPVDTACGRGRGEDSPPARGRRGRA